MVDDSSTSSINTVDYSFITQSFFCCLRFLHLSVVQDCIRYPNILRGLSHYQSELATNGPQGMAYLSMKICMDAALISTDLMSECVIYICTSAFTISLMYVLYVFVYEGDACIFASMLAQALVLQISPYYNNGNINGMSIHQTKSASYSTMDWIVSIAGTCYEEKKFLCCKSSCQTSSYTMITCILLSINPLIDAFAWCSTS
jgi:hypothetical protein